ASPYPPLPAPSAPTGLTAIAGIGRVMLNWTPSNDGAQGYSLQRATVSGGPYTTIASWTDNAFNQRTDPAVTGGTTYYYVLAAINQSGTSANSEEVGATPVAAGALPPGWLSRDLGAVNGPGAAGYANAGNNTFVVSGNGSGIGGTADSFSYAFGGVTGDVTMTARLLINGSIKVGLMMREALGADAKALSLTLGDVGGRETRFGTRSSAGGAMTFQLGNAYTWTPVWYRLQRSGDTFTAFQSSDGVAWFEIGSSSVPMSGTYLAGLSAVAGTATFDNVTIVGGGVPPPTPTDLTATAGGSSRIGLTWRASAGASGYSVKRATSAGGPYTTIARGVLDTSYVDTGLRPSTAYYYVISAGSLAGESSDSLPASATTFDPSLPPAPTGLASASGDARIALNWAPAPEAAGYDVKRATAIGGPYTTIANTTMTSYADTNVANGTTYYYVVSAINALGAGPDSSVVGGTPVHGQYGYWTFDETDGTVAADSWGGRNGMLGAGAALVTGAINNAVRLDGTSGGYVTLPSGLVSSLNDFTIAAWVKLEASQNWARLFDFGTGTNVYMFLTPRNGANGRLRYAITTGGGGGEQQINSNLALAVGVWTHLAVTLSDNVGILYVNGLEAGRNDNLTLKPSSLGQTSQNWLGRSQYPDPLLPGSIDDFRIYNLALSASEISNLCASHRPGITSRAAASGTYGTTFSYTIEATNSPFLFSATGLPPGLSIDTGNGLISGTPTATGTFAVTVSAANQTGAGSAVLNLEIAKARATVTLGNLNQIYDGLPRVVTATTDPADRTVILTYNGGETPPTCPGKYTVMASIIDANFTGSASGALVVRAPVLVRRAGVLTEGAVCDRLTIKTAARLSASWPSVLRLQNRETNRGRCETR
ncbi:MAG TPA: LamG-like jellyroll fold domain-containing protein, partial [Blastocatellia bacterium]|nr:LamG-like jellyroll fold domain-containing protein [Blastocatellia bacterium]